MYTHLIKEYLLWFVIGFPYLIYILLKNDLYLFTKSTFGKTIKDKDYLNFIFTYP